MEPYDRNTPYNALPLLPPDCNGFLTDKVLSSLTMASRLLSELKGMASMLPNQSMFLNTISLREAKTSTAIENIFTTDDELYEALSWKDVLAKIFEQPYIRPKNLLGESIKSLNTAKKYLTQLETLGLLSKVRIGNEYVFINASLMEVLSD